MEGLGGEKADGRWHAPARGRRIVYFSEHPALALVEALANLKGDPRLFPDSYQLMKVNAADSVSADILDPNVLLKLKNWRQNITGTQSMGNAWLANRSSALLAVPSAPSPESLNYLFNPLHPDAKGLAIEWCKQIEYDKRLFHINAT